MSQFQSPFLIPATWLLSDLYPATLYYCDPMIYPPKYRMDGCTMVHDLEIPKKGSTDSRELCRRWGHDAIVQYRRSRRFGSSITGIYSSYTIAGTYNSNFSRLHSTVGEGHMKGAWRYGTCSKRSSFRDGTGSVSLCSRSPQRYSRFPS